MTENTNLNPKKVQKLTVCRVLTDIPAAQSNSCRMSTDSPHQILKSSPWQPRAGTCCHVT